MVGHGCPDRVFVFDIIFYLGYEQRHCSTQRGLVRPFLGSLVIWSAEWALITITYLKADHPDKQPLSEHGGAWAARLRTTRPRVISILSSLPTEKNDSVGNIYPKTKKLAISIRLC
jgi:hypothetical protein